MKISIITPSFNQGRFIKDCIESVCNQTGVEVEHIIADAGSTDETLAILAQYPHLKWSSAPDKGMSDGINHGFRQATGDWVMWLNCDDYLLPGALASVASMIESNPQADVVHGECIFVSEDKKIIRRKYDTAVDEWDLLFVGCPIPSTSTFYRREIIDQGHLLDIHYHNCMDLEFYLRLMRLGFRFVYLPKPLAHFRWYDDSTTQRHWDRMIQEGLLCQRTHIEQRGYPSILKRSFVLECLRRVFRLRRIWKRILTHGKIR